MSAGIRAGSSNDGYVQVNGNDIITALSGGNVGIGTSSPSTKLHVNGTITATSFSGGLPISNEGNDRIITSSGSGAVNGEANLQFDGTNLFMPNELRHLGDPDTKIGFPAADQISFSTGATGSSVEYLKLHRYASVNFVEVGANANISFAKNASNSRSILIGDGNASSTGSLFLQAGGGSTGYGGGIRLYSHDNADNEGGVYIGKSLNSDGSIILGNGGTSPSHEYLKLTHGKATFKSQAVNAVCIALVDNDSSNEIWRVGQASDGDGYVEVLEDGGTVGCRLDASGNSFTMNNFGVGISSPGVKLHVDSGSSYSVGTFNSSHSNGILINLQRAGTNTGFIGSGKNIADATGGVDDVGMRSQANLIFTAGGGTERARITSAGNVGVNHTNPRGKFVINSTKNALVNANCNDPHHFHLSLKNEDENNTAIGLCFSHDATVDRVGAAIIHKRSGNGSVGDLRFYTCATEGTTSERLRIDSTGDVRFAGTNLTDNTNKSVNLTAPSYDIDEEDVNLVQVENESGFNQITFGGGTSALNAATKLRFLTAGSVNTTTGTERMRITSQGWVEHGKRFSGSSTVDTGIYVGQYGNYGYAVFEVIVAGNPNHFGSGAYAACSTYILSFGCGWTGSALSTRFRADRIGYGDGGSSNTTQVTATFHLWDSTTSTESSSGVAANGNNQLRIKIVGSTAASYCRCYIKMLSSMNYLN